MLEHERRGQELLRKMKAEGLVEGGCVTVCFALEDLHHPGAHSHDRPFLCHYDSQGELKRADCVVSGVVGAVRTFEREFDLNLGYREDTHEPIGLGSIVVGGSAIQIYKIIRPRTI